MNELIKPTLILADDHPLFMKGLNAVLQKEFLILAIASNGKELLDLLQTQQPNAILIDLQMPYMDGVYASKLIRIQYPHIKLIILSGYYDTEIADELKLAGVSGYLTKDIDRHFLVAQIERVIAGHTAFCKAKIEQNFLFQHSIGSTSTDPGKLSSRELQVVSLIKNGFTSNEIACRLFISVNTVEAHRKHIFRKLNIRNIQGLLQVAHNYSL